MHPAAADHRRDDLHGAQLLRLDRERVAVEHDEVGEQARHEAAATALVAEKRGATQVAQRLVPTVSACSGRQAGRSSIERRTPAAIPASGSTRPAPEPFATSAPSRAARGKRRCRRAGRPRAGRRGPVGGRVRELHRARDPELGEAGQILERQALGVLDPVPQALGLPGFLVASKASSAFRFAWSPPIGDADRPAALGGATDDSSSSARLVISTPVPSVISAVCEPSVPSMKHLR